MFLRQDTSIVFFTRTSLDTL
ncbi:hypothetical protein Zm00014a_013071 [Zea mays]|uniref:Uncharacterized protein n=1 Tax=Zea mays TaxID=4577 RepID=A0A3L6F095_MAIZE|nr:hypothetical protein Zm00014a_013071 [Zea mays]